MRKIEKCPLCGQVNAEKFWALRGYRLAKCIQCGMIWDPLSSNNPSSQYEKDYFINKNSKGGYSNYFKGMAINKRTFFDRLRKIEKRFGKKGKLLDVGCALGDCLIEAEKLGWKNAEGLEISNYACKYAKRRGVKIKKDYLKRGMYKKNTFDVVTYQDVIEHISNPVYELKKVYEILKPGGIIFIVTPDVGGLWSKMLGSLWYHYKPEEHVVYFSKRTIKIALEKVGFVNIKTGRTHHVLSLGYIFDRLRYYGFLFDHLHRLAKDRAIGNIRFRSYIGELEAWAQKPL
ncbi:class I SAM-dependent methyltransferase [Candidatus Woesebacteria bacterium]|nr:class I SAM-dependent methyltransferase [Candidatus Woesebacteria bacterium]